MKKKNNLNNQVNNYSSSSINICLLNTIDYNKSLFTKIQIRQAEKARKLQQLIGWPGTEAFKNIIQNNMVKNCSITVDDIDRAIKIFGIPE